MKRVAVTGAAGLVGTGLRGELLAMGHRLLLLDRRPVPDPAEGEEAVRIDIAEQDRLATLLRGCDAVVHLAACTTTGQGPRHSRLCAPLFAVRHGRRSRPPIITRNRS